MSSFDLLHPALQHHIANSLGWNDLRPFQNAVIPRILDGENLIVLAPTAGGKTEASFFPTLSNMLTDEWDPLSVLYICPIKALLNNLDAVCDTIVICLADARHYGMVTLLKQPANASFVSRLTVC